MLNSMREVEGRVSIVVEGQGDLKRQKEDEDQLHSQCCELDFQKTNLLSLPAPLFHIPSTDNAGKPLDWISHGIHSHLKQSAELM